MREFAAPNAGGLAPGPANFVQKTSLIQDAAKRRMAELFTAKYQILWMIALAGVLFLPVRQMIWVISVRRAERDGDQNENRRQALKRRAGVTAVLMGFVFAYVYTNYLFEVGP
jgi:hypothetical protein